MVQDFEIIRPKIAVLGINPPETMELLGTKTIRCCGQPLDTIRSNGKLVYGPYSADSFWFGKLQKLRCRHLHPITTRPYSI